MSEIDVADGSGWSIAGMIGDTPFRACSFSDPHDYEIDIDGKLIRFEWSDRFGPISSREFTKRQWACLQAWIDQGKRHVDHECVYDAPRSGA